MAMALAAVLVVVLDGVSAAQCALNPASPSVTICSPINGATVSSPVSVVAGTTDTAHPVTAMKVYLDNVAVYHVYANQLSTSLSMAGGQHNITVNAWDASGAVFKSTVIITVSGSTAGSGGTVNGGGTAPVSVSVSPHSAMLAPGQPQQFTSTVLNTTNTAVTWSVDGITLGNTTVGTITASGLYTAGTGLGNHNVVATSTADPTKSDTAIVTVTAPASGGGSCTPGSTVPSVTICSPVAGSTVTGPVNVQAVAASNTAVTKFLVYVDYVLAYQTLGTTSLSTNLTLASGSHNLTVQFYNGAWVKQAENIVVTSAAPAVTISVTPATASVAPNGTQQFIAAVQNASNTAVTWVVDGTPNGNSTVGTITGSGNTVTYTAPAATGTHTVTATSMADTTKSASATVNVGSTAQTFPSSNHVFVIMEENQSFSAVFPNGSATNCGSAGMPYLCGLAASNGLALNFYSNEHGSLLDYLQSTSGSDWTASPYNCNGGTCASVGVITGDNIVRALQLAGKTWRGYFESMPSQGYLGGDTGDYVQRHNPFVWYSDVANSSTEPNNMVPFTQFAQDVNAGTFSNFNYIIPNLVNDADAGAQTPGALMAAADSWLQTNIAPLLATAPFQAGGDGILIIVFDEGNVAGESGATTSDNACSPTQSGCGGHVAMVMIGPNVSPGSTTTQTYQFQDMLHTVLHLLGITDFMNGTSGAADIQLLPGS